MSGERIGHPLAALAKKEEKKWHRHTIICPRCRRPVVIYSLAFTSGGDVKANGICITCALKICWEGDITEIMADCCKAESGEAAGEDEQKTGKALVH